MAFYRVLVPLDGSELAEEALVEAKRLTNGLGRILLVTAVDNDVPKLGGVPFYPLMGMGLAYLKASAEELHKKFQEYLAGVMASLQGFNVDVDIRYGNPMHVILDAAEDFEADVIVMSSHGRSGISRQIIGSVAGCVSSTAPCPVLVIPAAEKRLPAKEVV